jgi:hypothetical protein
MGVVPEASTGYNDTIDCLLACTCREAAGFVTACVPVVAGTALVGHTLERLLQLQRAPPWAADPQHLAAARAATAYLGYEALMYRPVLIDVKDWYSRKVSAKVEEHKGLARALGADGGPPESPLRTPAATATSSIIKLHLASQVPCAKATIQPWYQNSTTRR